MIILSNTDKGGKIVEFSEDEFRELYALAKSCDPQMEDAREAFWDLRPISRDTRVEYANNFDFTTVFGNVRAFREMQYATNKIKNLGKALEDAIRKNA